MPLIGTLLLVLVGAPWARLAWLGLRKLAKAISPRHCLPLLILVAALVGCTRVPPGHVGIKVNNLGSDRGVQSYTIKTGIVFYIPGVSTVLQ